MGVNSKEKNRSANREMKLRFTPEEYEKALNIFKELSIRNRNKYVKNLILNKRIEENEKGQNKQNVNIHQEQINQQMIYQLNKIGNNLNQISKRINSMPEAFIAKDDKTILYSLQQQLDTIITKSFS